MTDKSKRREARKERERAKVERREARRRPELVAKTSKLRMLVIYDHPTDLPDGFVMRAHHVLSDGSHVAEKEAIVYDAPTLESVRELVPHGMINIGRSSSDDSKIVEVWV